MKMLTLILIVCLSSVISGRSQVIGILQLITSKLVRAIDLKVQQLQNEALNMTVLQKQLENRFAKEQLGQIASWEEKQKELYQGYFEELRSVKTAISFVGRVSEVIQKQKQVVTDTQKMIGLLYTDNHFSVTEVQEFVNACNSILDQGANNLSLLLKIVSGAKFSMSDGERLTSLMLVKEEVEDLDGKLYGLLGRVRSVLLSRERSAIEIQNIKRLYGFR